MIDGWIPRAHNHRASRRLQWRPRHPLFRTLTLEARLFSPPPPLFLSGHPPPPPLSRFHFPQIKNHLPPQNPKSPIPPNPRRNHRRSPRPPPPLSLLLRLHLLHHSSNPHRRSLNQQATNLHDLRTHHPQCAFPLRNFHRSVHCSDFPLSQSECLRSGLFRQAASDGFGVREGGADHEVPAGSEVAPVAEVSGLCVAGTGEGAAGGGGY